MIRLVATGVWICLVTMVSSYAATLWQTETTPKEEVDSLFGGLEAVKTNDFSVPVIASGAVRGYVIAKFSFTMKSEPLHRMSVKPDVFLLDSAFRTIYSTDASILQGAKQQDLQERTAAIKSRANARFGEPIVEDVLIEKYSYLPKDETRDGAKLKEVEPEKE